MSIREIIDILRAEMLCGGKPDLDTDIWNACGSDMMSDALAFVKDQSLLLTGLVNPQTIRTAAMLDMLCVVFVRGKRPGRDVLDLAEEAGIVVLTTQHRMYNACGKLYAAGLGGGAD